VENSFGDPVWFLWPVTFALLAGTACRRLLRRGAVGAAALVVVALALPVVPLTWAIPVSCGDDTAFLDLRPAALGLGLLGIVAWFAVVFRARVRAGDDRDEADRGVLWGAAAMVGLMVLEFIPSVLTMADYCIDGDSPARLAHLGAAVAAFAIAGIRRPGRGE
jgi:hypothetical protein